MPTIDKRICFIHIPKCGGTSVTNGFQQAVTRFKFTNKRASCYRLPSIKSAQLATDIGISINDYRRVLAVEQLNNRKCLFIGGHVSLSPHLLRQYSAEWLFITLLRHPVDRFLSSYLYNRYKLAGHFRLDMPLAEYIQSPLAVQEAAILVRYLSGQMESPPAQYMNLVEPALDALRLYGIVGFTDDMAGFEKLCQKELGRKILFPHHNQNPADPDIVQQEITGEIRGEIEALCTADLAFYTQARRRLLP